MPHFMRLLLHDFEGGLNKFTEGFHCTSHPSVGQRSWMIDFVLQAFCDDITLQTIHTIIKDITATYEMEITVSAS